MKKDELVPTQEAAKMLGVSASFLERDRWLNPTDPHVPYIRICRSIKYLKSDIETLIKNSRVGNLED